VDHAAGQRAKLSGGVPIPPEAWRPATVPSGAAGVLAVDLFKLGLNASSLGGMGHPYIGAKLELFLNGRSLLLARDPNVDSGGTWQWAGYENMKVTNESAFALADAPLGSRWQAAWAGAAAAGGAEGELWLHGFWKFDW
jgi:hypothetical protein